jgi:hypothetical protein
VVVFTRFYAFCFIYLNYVYFNDLNARKGAIALYVKQVEQMNNGGLTTFRHILQEHFLRVLSN